MFNLLGSLSKEKIFIYLSNNPNKTLNEISKETHIQYKYVYKIINEFLDNKIIEKNRKTYSLTTEFVEYYRKIADLMTESYVSNIYLKNRLDLYNAFCSLEQDEKVKAKVNDLIDSWFFRKLDDWYSRFYDHDGIEYRRIKEAIENRFGRRKGISILEVGCGTGRTSFQMVDDYKDITAIDISQKFVDYCNKKAKTLKKKVRFETSDIGEYKSERKFDVIIFNWMGFHYQPDTSKIIANISKLLNDDSMVLILDAYYDTEYIRVLQMLRESDIRFIKMKKEELNEKLIKEFGNFQQEVIFTRYDFDTIQDVIDNFKIELTLEESHIWTRKDEQKLKRYLEKKKDPLSIEEGLWFSTISINSAS